MGSPTESLEFCRKYLRGHVFDEWLQLVRLHGYAQGGTLAVMLGTPRDGLPGMTDSVYAADLFLAAAEHEGLIVRTRHDPTNEIAFFGCGGARSDAGSRTGGHGRWSLGG